MLMPDEKAPYTLMISTARRLPGRAGHSSSPHSSPTRCRPHPHERRTSRQRRRRPAPAVPSKPWRRRRQRRRKDKGRLHDDDRCRSGGCPRPRRGRGHDDAEIRHRHRDRDRRLHADTAADQHLNPGSHRADSRGGVPGSLREGAGLHSAGQQGLRAEENTAALAALPDDPRGAQRTAIDAMPEAGAATPPPDLGWNSPSWNDSAKPRHRCQRP